MGVNPDAQQSLPIITKTIVLAPSVGQKLVDVNTSRKYLLVQNTGTNPLTVREDSIPAAGAGLSLDGASLAGGQGGTWNPTDVVPTNALFGFSTAGSTVVVVEG